MPANTTYLGTGGGPNAGEGQTAPLSIVTLTNATGFVQGQLGLIQNASGFSVFYSSGKSIYYFGGSTLSAAQP